MHSLRDFSNFSPISTKLCTLDHSCAVLVYAKFGWDRISCNKNNCNQRFYQVWISIQTALVRRCESGAVIMRSNMTNYFLTHWGRATHICVGKLTTIGSDNGLSPGRRQAIIWTIAGILLIGPLGTNFSEISIGIQLFSLKKMHLKMSSAKWRPFVSASMC